MSRLTILVYHRVLPARDDLLPEIVDAVAFRRQMSAIARVFNVMPLAEAVGRLQTGSLPARAACITFDDGYADNLDVAAPILDRLGVPATFFIAAGFLDGTSMWNDRVIEAIRRARGPFLDTGIDGVGTLGLANWASRRQALKIALERLKYLSFDERAQAVAMIESRAVGDDGTRLMLDRQGVAALHRKGFDVGAHTMRHPILKCIEPEVARQEIVESKCVLERITQAPVRLFAYPNGKPDQDYGAEHVRMVREAGFIGAVSTAWGVAEPGADIFQLPRFTAWDASTAKFTLRMLHNLTRREYELAH